jgi:hypothetical protein
LRWNRLPEAKELLMAWQAALVNPGVYPDDLAFIALSRVAVELGHLDEAREWAERARDCQALDDPERTRVAGCLAVVEFTAGNLDEARELIEVADADIRGQRGYFDYLVTMYRSRLARMSGDLEVAVGAVREAIGRLLEEGRVVYLLEALPEAVAVLSAAGNTEAADRLAAELHGWQQTMQPPILPTAWAVLAEARGSVRPASGWPRSDGAAAVEQLADDALTALV